MIQSIENSIREWNPPSFSKELHYRDALYARLRDLVPDDCVVEKEYRHHGTTIDLWLKWRGLLSVTELGFELKLNLTKKAEFDRLIGQIEGMEPSKTNIIIIIIGEVEEAFLMKLRHRYAEKIEDAQYWGPTMAIIHVPIGA